MSEARRVNRMRKAARVSYSELARELGYSVATVWDVLNGKRTSAPLLRNVAEYLGKSISPKS